jgi:hypothetical protein
MTIPAPAPAPAACREHLERDEDRCQDGEPQWYAAEVAVRELRQERHANVTISGFTRFVRKPCRQA